jgi:hypothetical protein
MNDDEPRKPYIKPEIIHEMDLETRAGSTPVPEQVDDPFDIQP